MINSQDKMPLWLIMQLVCGIDDLKKTQAFLVKDQFTNLQEKVQYRNITVYARGKVPICCVLVQVMTQVKTQVMTQEDILLSKP